MTNENIERAERMHLLAERCASLVREFGRRQDITVTYDRPNDTTIRNYSDFQREYHGIVSGNEYFLIWETDKEVKHLLYIVNVTADSAIAAAWELLDLASRKF